MSGGKQTPHTPQGQATAVALVAYHYTGRHGACAIGDGPRSGRERGESEREREKRVAGAEGAGSHKPRHRGRAYIDDMAADLPRAAQLGIWNALAKSSSARADSLALSAAIILAACKICDDFPGGHKRNSWSKAVAFSPAHHCPAKASQHVGTLQFFADHFQVRAFSCEQLRLAACALFGAWRIGRQFAFERP